MSTTASAIEKVVGNVKGNAVAVFSGMLIIMFTGLALQIIVAQWTEITSLRRELRLLQTARTINQDQVAELTYTLQQMRTEQTVSGQKDYVAGIVAALTQPNENLYGAIWHDGYDRGTAVQAASDAVESRYTVKPQE